MPSQPRLDLVHKAICAGIWGHIEWKPEGLKLMLANPKMKGYTGAMVRHLLREYVVSGNSLGVREQDKELWKEDEPYWYKAKIPADDFPDGLFVEVILWNDDEDCPSVRIVSAHP
jgi:hypothetical protein